MFFRVVPVYCGLFTNNCPSARTSLKLAPCTDKGESLTGPSDESGVHQDRMANRTPRGLLPDKKIHIDMAVAGQAIDIRKRASKRHRVYWNSIKV